MPATEPSMAPCCSAGSTSPSVIATGVAPSRLNASDWNCEAKILIFLPLKSARCRMADFEITQDGCAAISPTPCSPLSAPSDEHQFEHRRIGGNALAMFERIDEARSGHHFEALVDADEKLRRNGAGLDRAELHAFDLARDRAQLACRIDLALDPAAGIPFDRRGEILGELVRCIVDRRRA